MTLITNRDRLVAHGDQEGRDLALQILEGGMAASDPYLNTRKLIRREGHVLHIGGCPEMDVSGYGDETVDLNAVGDIYVLGAGKAIQSQAKAIEDVLGDRLTGGAVTIKHGEKAILERIEVTCGAHPVPDQGSVDGAQKMVDIVSGLNPNDLVFTLFSDGASSLSPLPMPGVTLDDLHALYRLAIKYGDQRVIVRNVAYFSQLSRGRLLRMIHPARSVNLVMQLEGHPRWHGVVPEDPNFCPNWPPGTLRMADDVPGLVKEPWFGELPDVMREVYARQDPAYDIPKLEPFRHMRATYYEPIDQQTMMRGMLATCDDLGIQAVPLASLLGGHSAQAARAVASIADECCKFSRPWAPPVALLTMGHLNVPMGESTGVGGRNQEFALAYAQLLGEYPFASKRVVVAAMDSDGTDGPGMIREDGSPYCAAGGIVDGYTAEEALARGVDAAAELANHNATPALLALDSAIHTGNTGTCLGDLRVVFVR